MSFFISDEFSGSSLRADWTEESTDGYAIISVHDGYLELELLDGYTNLYDGYGQTAPIVTQSFNSDSDFDIMARFLNLPSKNITSCGLIFLEDSSNFILWTARYENDALQTYNTSVQSGSEVFSNLDSVTENPEYLRVIRRGNQFRFYYSAGGSSWILQDTQTQSITINEIGIVGTNDI